MRQAGRYHSHYRALKDKYSFLDLCKTPELACQVTMGPINAFDFDAAILFSDILFPLEAMGMQLKYDPGPILSWYIKTVKDVARLESNDSIIEKLEFQSKAINLIRKRLPTDKDLIGFVGGPLTLFSYAIEGQHEGTKVKLEEAINDGRFSIFSEKLIKILIGNMCIQAQAGADTVAIFDTSAGLLDITLFNKIIAPCLLSLITLFKKSYPNTPVIYYSKGTGKEHWDTLKSLNINCLGIDWNHDISCVLNEYQNFFSIQGNFNPNILLDNPLIFEKHIIDYFAKIKSLPKEQLKGWICGLGHGVLPGTPEQNVKTFIKLQKEYFS